MSFATFSVYFRRKQGHLCSMDTFLHIIFEVNTSTVEYCFNVTLPIQGK